MYIKMKREKVEYWIDRLKCEIGGGVCFVGLLFLSHIKFWVNCILLLRHLTARLALGWRIRLTQHLLQNYLRSNVFYKVIENELLLLLFLPLFFKITSTVLFMISCCYLITQLSIICTMILFGMICRPVYCVGMIALYFSHSNSTQF